MVIAQPHKAVAKKRPAIEHMGTRYQHERIMNHLRDFLDVTDDQTANDINHLYKVYNRLDSILHDDKEGCRRMKRSVRAVIKLVRTLRQYNDKGGFRWVQYIKDERIKWRDCLLNFVHSSDEDAGSWIDYLYTEYLCSPEFDNDTRDTRWRIRLNISETAELARILHEHHKGGGIDKFAM